MTMLKTRPERRRRRWARHARRRGRLAVSAIALSITPAVLLPSTASANSHALAIFTATTYGACVYEYSATFTLSDPGSDAIDNDLWVNNDNNCDGSYWCWIEDGIAKGYVCVSANSNQVCSQNADYTSPVAFWADNRPNNGGYHWHSCGGINASTGRTAQIQHTSGGSWSIDSDGGPCSGSTSTSNFTSSNFLAAGSETSNTATAQLCSWQIELEYVNGSGNWVNNWEGASLRADSGMGITNPATGELRETDNC